MLDTLHRGASKNPDDFLFSAVYAEKSSQVEKGLLFLFSHAYIRTKGTEREKSPEFCDLFPAGPFK